MPAITPYMISYKPLTKAEKQKLLRNKRLKKLKYGKPVRYILKFLFIR